MRLLLISGMLWTYTLLSAQTIPDFTVTDSRGVEHTLYSDYLDQGKTVMIKVFFSSCPPCNAIASDIQELYVDWGEGIHDVQFIELSDKSFDDDTRVNAYKDRHSSTSPAAGADGGSLEAVAPYQSAPIGPYFGTPTFIVVAPDGTYEFDVSPRIDALDAAIARTGAEKPDGMMQREFALNTSVIDCISNLPLQGAEITVSLRPLDSAPDTLVAKSMNVITTDNGLVQIRTSELPDYAFYEAAVSNMGTVSCGDPTLGVSLTDLIVIQRHILGVSEFEDNCRLFASDVDDNQVINVLDLLKLQSILFELDDFEEETLCRIISGCDNPWISLAEDPENVCAEPYYLIRMGDVD